MLQGHLVRVDASNLLRDIVALVFHGRLQNVAVDVSVLEGQLQLLVRLLGAGLELVELLNQELDVLRHLSFKGALCLSQNSMNFVTWTPTIETTFIMTESDAQRRPLHVGEFHVKIEFQNPAQWV